MISVLYVDDEPGLLEIAQIFLEATGDFRVTTATSAADALESLHISSYDAIIADYQMPDIDGIAFLKTVRAQFGDIPFILFTGRGREAVVIDAINNGVDFYLQKGGDVQAQFAELAHKIRQATARRHAQAELRSAYDRITESEKELRESEEKYRMLVEVNQDIIYSLDPDGTIYYASPQITRQLGYLSDEMVGHNLTEFIHPADVGILTRHIEENSRAISPSVNFDQFRVRRKDGTYRWYEDKTIYTKDSRDRQVLIGTIRDITEQKLAKEASFASQQMLQTVLDTIPQRVFWKDKNLVFLGCNKSLARDAGFSEPAAMVGKTDYDHASAATADLYRADDREVMETGQPKINYEEPQVKPDGSKAWLRASKVPLRNREGEITGILGTYEDITEQKRAEAALADRESRLRSFIEGTRDAVSLIDEDGTVIEWNHSAEQITGIKKEEALGSSLWDLTARLLPREQRTGGRRAAIEQSIRTMLETGVPVFDGPQVIESELPDGTRIFTRQTIFPIKTDKGFRFGTIAHDITHEKQEEAGIRESEKKYHELAELLPQMIFEVDLDFRITYANWHTLTTLGFTQGDVERGINALSFIISPQHRTVKENVSKFLSGIPFKPQEYTARKKDGVTFPIIIYTSPIYREKILAGFRGVAVDISARKEMEEALRESEERFRGMAERSSDIILILNKEMSPTYVSPSVRPILGFDPEELVGKSPEFALATIFSETGPALMSAVQSTMKGLPVENTELQISRKDKTPVTVSICAVPVMHEDILCGAQISMRDITEKRKAEQALHESEKKFRDLVETTPDWVWEIDLTGTHTYSNPAVLDLLGYEVSEITGTSSFPLIHPDDKPRVRELLAQCIEEKDERPYTTTIRWLKKDGTSRLFESAIIPIINEKGELTGFRGIDRDITERKQAEDALLLANRKLTMLNGITRHDINNQLMVLMSYLSLLEESRNDRIFEQYLSKVTAAAERISTMIQFTKDYEEIGVTAPAWQEIRALVDTAVHELYLGKVSVKNTLPSGMEVFADPLIIKVFYNLIDNAIRYGGNITTIRFSCENHDNERIIVCEDDGVGVAPGEKQRIFERGYGKNTGMGLALSLEILSLTGIMIKETGKPGQGARFEITVPGGAFRLPRMAP